MSWLRSHRWEIGVGVAAAATAVALVALAVTAVRGLAQSRELALDGRLLRLAHGVEAELREGGPEAVDSVLAAAQRANEEWVAALRLEAGEEMGSAASPIGSAEVNAERRVDLFLGRAWGGGPMGSGAMHGGGWGSGRPGARRVLVVSLAATARHLSTAERALVPAAMLVGAVLLGLAAVVAVGLRRERQRELEAFDHRRLEALGRAGAGLAHQLRNPLATVKGTCQLLAESGQEDARGRLRRVLGEVERMERLLAELLDYTRPPSPEPAEVALAPLLAELTAAHTQLTVTCEPELLARVDREHLREILENLLDNARAVNGEGAVVEIAARRRSGGLRPIEIEVADRGPGPGPDPEAWFEPYATGRVDGIGLGLPLARSLATANGATLELGARPGGGAVARLRLPAGET